MALALVLATLWQAQPVILTDCVAVSSVGRSGRIPFPTDALVQQLVNESFRWPGEGDPIGERKWEKAKANADGWFEGRPFSGGYAAFTVNWPREESMLLNATGHGMVYVNGEPRGGDVYGYGYSKLPVHMKQGENRFLVATGRGRLRMVLEPPKADGQFNTGDLTLPDIVLGSKGEPYFGAVIIANTSDRRKRDLRIESAIGKDTASIKVPTIPQLSTRKCRFDLPPTDAFVGESVEVTLTLKDGDETVDTAKFAVRVRKPDQSRRETFMSDIDGSVQYYAVVPPAEPRTGLGLVLTVHGASVEAQGQAEAYSSKPWCWIVAPTNRRPYGFDWEDWGRMDAMEVLEIVRRKYSIDPSKIYLTGHSMGGHGTWQLGVLFPNVFAAIAPSAGWRSFYTYAGKPRIEKPTAMEAFFERTVSGTDTEKWAENYANEEVYILHGDADDNVPVTEARAMKTYFESVKKPIGYFEQKGAGHWWDGDKSPGADCVDWPEIFAMFEKARLARWTGTPQEGKLKFATPNPAVSSRMDFVEIRQQDKKLEPSRIEVVASKDSMALTTQNVRAVRVGPLLTSIDGQPFPKVSTTGAAFVDLVKQNGKWAESRTPVRLQTGPFKEAFKRGMVFVYSTRGKPAENAWTFAKARFDAEQWWYRGNGAVDVVADADFIDSSPRRNLVLYGNRDCNLLWQRLLVTAPMQLATDYARADGQIVRGDMGCVFALELNGRMIAGIGGTSLKGMRTTDRLPYFSAGIAYPDWTLIGPNAPTDGTAGVYGAGFWGEPAVWNAK